MKNSANPKVTGRGAEACGMMPGRRFDMDFADAAFDFCEMLVYNMNHLNQRSEP